MRSILAALLCAVVLVGVQAEPCDPATAGASLIDLTEPIGRLACKVPASVNLVDVMGKLTGTLKNLKGDQLQQLPGLIDLMAGIEPSALQPFLSLSAEELEKLVPMLTEVPIGTLQVALPLLAKQDLSVLQRMLKFLSKVTLAKLQQLSPLFGKLTQGQVNVLIHALNVLLEHAWDKLIAIVQASGPATDGAVAVKQHFGLIGGSSGSKSKSISIMPSISIGPKTTVGSSHGGNKTFSFGFGKGRKMLQACDPGAKGLEIGVALLIPFGDTVCQFGPDVLKPVLLGTIEALLKQSPETLARLPALTDVLSKVDAKVMSVFLRIPPSTLRALIPLFGGLDSAKVGAQLKALASADAAAVSKMVYFLKAVPGDKLGLLVETFAKLTDKQADTMAKFMNALSPGQIVLSLHLLENFGFAVDVIGQHVPQYSG